MAIEGSAESHAQPAPSLFDPSGGQMFRGAVWAEILLRECKEDIPVRLPNGDRRASEELAEALEAALAGADVDEVVTLGAVRDRLKEMLAEQGGEASGRSEGAQSVYAELQALVEEFGEDVPARDFIEMKASENLAGLIEELLTTAEDEDGITIGLVREAVKEASIDPDAEHALVAELDALIERYGEHALAEEVLPYER
jgi:hypothetical protein